VAVTSALRPTLDDYRAVAPRGTLDVLLRIADTLRGRSIVHVTGSRYGGVAPFLNRAVPILSTLGIDTAWEVVVGTAELDGIVRTVSRALAGTEQVVTEGMLARLRATCADNAARLPLEADLVVTHDATPLLLVDRRRPGGCWVWRGHGDLSSPQPQVWGYLRPFLGRYDAAVFSLPRFAPPLPIPRYLVQPSIDPLGERNRDMTRAEQAERLARLGVPRDKPLLLQVGDFDRDHDPLGVINAYRLVKRYHEVRLVLAGPAPLAPGEVLAEVRQAADEDPDIVPLALPAGSDADLNALERAAAIVIHKPLRADFALDVTAAMWKGKPVVGSATGGIPVQIVFNVTGYLVETVEGAAFRVRHLLSHPELLGRMGAAGREQVRRHFLITRHLGDYLGLLAHLAGSTARARPSMEATPTAGAGP
jgi:trehalose synthase